MKSEEIKNFFKLYERANPKTRQNVRDILGSEPSEKLWKKTPPDPEMFEKAMRLLRNLRSQAGESPKEYLETEAYWTERIATSFGQALHPELLEAVTRITKAENLGKQGVGVSPSLEESKWEIYCFLALLLPREGFDPELAEFCGVSEQEYSLKLEMGRYHVTTEKELEEAKAIRAFLDGLSSEDRKLALKIIKAVGEADIAWRTVKELVDDPNYYRAEDLEQKLEEVGAIVKLRIRRRF